MIKKSTLMPPLTPHPTSEVGVAFKTELSGFGRSFFVKLEGLEPSRPQL